MYTQILPLLKTKEVLLNIDLLSQLRQKLIEWNFDKLVTYPPLTLLFSRVVLFWILLMNLILDLHDKKTPRQLLASKSLSFESEDDRQNQGRFATIEIYH